MSLVQQPTRTKRRSLAEINVVPYIDVMLVLLVIFMITAPLLAQGVKVDLPDAAAESLPPEASLPIVVTVDTNGSYFLNVNEQPETPVEASNLVVLVAAELKARADAPVMVRGDSAVPYGEVVKVMTLLQSAGAKSIGLVTQPPEKKSP